MKKDEAARQRCFMQKDSIMQVHPTGTDYEITIPALGGSTVSGATWSEALTKAIEAIAQAREILARKQQCKAATTQPPGTTVA
jgi:hypothetical protein